RAAARAEAQRAEGKAAPARKARPGHRRARAQRAPCDGRGAIATREGPAQDRTASRADCRHRIPETGDRPRQGGTPRGTRQAPRAACGRAASRRAPAAAVRGRPAAGGRGPVAGFDGGAAGARAAGRPAAAQVQFPPREGRRRLAGLSRPGRGRDSGRRHTRGPRRAAGARPPAGGRWHPGPGAGRRRGRQCAHRQGRLDRARGAQQVAGAADPGARPGDRTRSRCGEAEARAVGTGRAGAEGMSRGLVVILLAACLAGCGADASPPVTETVATAPLAFAVRGTGRLVPAKATPLRVPGENWSSRTLEWMVPEGSFVHKGDVVARFTSEQGKQDLAQAMLDLRRNQLAHAAKQLELQAGEGRVAVDLSQVGVQLGIAERYAEADLSTLARNEVLDAVQDADFLGRKQDTLEWKRDRAGVIGGAELAVLDAQRATYQVKADAQRKDLEALELR